MKNSVFLSVVLSFFNEENNLSELICRLRGVMNNLLLNKKIHEYELIFVNDNSSDNSVSLIKSLMGQGDIKLINMSRNFGVSECVLAGMHYTKGDAVVYMDADLQDPPEIIIELLNQFLDDPDAEVVYTTRRSRKNESKIKLLLTKLGYRLIKKISRVEIPIDSGDFKLLSRKVVDILIQMRDSDPYIRGMIAWIGFKQIQVLYDRDGRGDGKENTKMNLMSGKVLNYWLDKALISFSDAPLKLTLGLGLFSTMLAFVGFIFIVLQKILGFAIPGWSAIMASILFFGGIQLFVIGLAGLYIGNIFRQSKNRPLYIVSEIIDG
jgi:glycosyltransferase involved in cell wall biosynthesis